ncbi:MAG: hypothetical protein ACEY3L_04525 [Wolbachia sp.]|uniref:hypothetical protein n=1 Tax=Wolbachia pipientis TaxID=955 RepID=UPI001C70BFC6|nr:hypothetical protein [Wolbachia pipientis]
MSSTGMTPYGAIVPLHSQMPFFCHLSSYPRKLFTVPTLNQPSLIIFMILE